MNLESLTPDLPTHGIEARRWTVVFHRKSCHWLFAALACGHFKHVSAFAWIPELKLWTFYDCGFRRATFSHMIDGPEAHAVIGHLAAGNALITMDVRDDNLPWFRLGLFCTSAVAHLIGIGSLCLRPDALYRACIAHGGKPQPSPECVAPKAALPPLPDDDGRQPTETSDRPQLSAGTGKGAAETDREPAGRGRDRHREPDVALRHAAGAG